MTLGNTAMVTLIVGARVRAVSLLPLRQPTGRSVGWAGPSGKGGLLNEHSAWFACCRLHPYRTPRGFYAFLTTRKSLIARCRNAAAISGAHTTNTNT